MSNNISVSIALFNPETGERIRNVGSINMNTANPGEFTTPVVIRMFANNVKKIKNVKLAVVDSSTDVESGGTTNTDGSVTSGNMGIEHGKIFEEKSSLSSFFPGKNITGLSFEGKSVSIETITEDSTEFVYLNAKAPSQAGSNYVKYKWFFDMA